MSNIFIYLNRAIKAHASGCLEEARSFYKKTLIEDPQNSTALGWLGSIEAQLKNYDLAEDLLKKAIIREKNNYDFLLNYANLLFEKRQFHNAVATYQKVIRQRPSDPICFANLAACHNELGKPLLALRVADQALQLKPDYAEAWSNRGNALYELNRYEEALTSYERALELKPDHAEAWSNRGNTLCKIKRNNEALTSYERALELKPDYAEAWSNRGNALYELNRYEEAITHQEKAQSLKHYIDWASGDLLHTKMKICSWPGLAESMEDISKKVLANKKVIQPFPLLALNDDALLHKKVSEINVQSRYPFNPVLGPILKRPQSQKIRIGYFSADFHNHATGYLMAELFELHDKSQFELVGFSFGPIANDEIRQRLEKSFDQFIEVGAKSDVEIAKLSRNLNIDIAVDLKGFTQDARTGIFANRAAPIQVNYLGYPGTMGASYIDYIIADKTLIPSHSQPFYSEKVVYLPNSYQVNDSKRVISDRQFTRQELGLPEDSFVFCCFNNNYKILPETFAGWMRILKAVDGSVLWLFQDNSWAEENLRKQAEKEGVAPDRLVFAKRLSLPEHLARHRQADLFLDTFPYNAHTTASDTLWAELPILTLIGNSFASRVAASLLNAIDLPELITRTQEEYEALAIDLANSPQRLADLKQKLANNRLTTPLFDTPLFAKNLEEAYTKMYEGYMADLEPEHLFIV